MLRIADSPEWVAYAKRLASTIDGDDQLVLPKPSLRQRLIARIKTACPKAIHLPIPAAGDQVERVVLDLATALGEGPVEAVGGYLRESPDDLRPSLKEFDAHLSSRPLIVDGWNALGFSGVGRELDSALLPRAKVLRNWLDTRGTMFIGRRTAPSHAHIPDAPTTAPIELLNGGRRDTSGPWGGTDHDADHYSLYLAALALGMDEDELEEASEEELRCLIFELLPEPATQCLVKLSVHARPLLQRHLSRDAEGNVALGENLGLWHSIGDTLVVEAGWTEFIKRFLTPQVIKARHRDLALSFAKDFDINDKSTDRVALSVLEAHRHFVGAGDLARAMECWRYGASLLVDRARERSLERDFAAAAKLYGQVLEAAESRKLPLPTRLRAYAKHYLHFNRARDDSESLLATERGYRAALKDWRENALFWSRLVRVVCYQERFGAALDDLDEAQQVVPQHAQKQTVLVARTVRGLVDRGHVLEAIRIWGDYQPDTPKANEVANVLEGRLRDGWTITRLTIDEDEPLVFCRKTPLRIVRVGKRWSAELPSLEIFAAGSSPLVALQGLIGNVRREASSLVRAYTSDLSPAKRFRKRLLLGALDIPVSRLDGPRPETYWFFGTLHRDAQEALWFRTGGERDLWFEIPQELAENLVVDERMHFARVQPGDEGTPVGPVIEIEEGFRGSEDELWDEWRRLVADAG